MIRFSSVSSKICFRFSYARAAVQGDHRGHQTPSLISTRRYSEDTEIHPKSTAGPQKSQQQSFKSIQSQLLMCLALILEI